MYKIIPSKVGYFQKTFDPSQLLFLTNEILDIQNNFEKSIGFNSNLAGNIEQEYLLSNSHKELENLLLPLILEYHQYSDILNRFNVMSEDLPLYLDRSWVNFQKKHEFNPVHDHNGLLSFVLWLKVPYTSEDELKKSPGRNSNNNTAGLFEFIHQDALGYITSTKIFPEENTVIIFPSRLSHQVYPFFTSDNYRISVSGNFKLLVRY